MGRTRKVIPETGASLYAEVIAAGEQAKAEAVARGRELIMNTRDGHKPKRRRNQPGREGWMNSPATWKPFRAAWDAMVAIATEEQLVDGQLKRIQAAGFKGEKEVYIWPTDEHDADGIEVKWTKRGQPFMNLHEVMKDLDLLVPIGCAQRFDLLDADEHSPHTPALMIRMNKSLETKSIRKSKKKAGTAKAGAGEQK